MNENKINEIEEVKKLTGATEDRIKLHDDGYWSRAYVVNNGEYVVKFPRNETVSYKNEAKVLDHLNTLKLPINIQKVKWMADDGHCVVFHGVKGKPLSEMRAFTYEQKQNIAKQLGAFIKLLHSVDIEVGEKLPEEKMLDGEISSYQEIYGKLTDFYTKFMTQEERSELDNLMYNVLPKERKKLGAKRVFSHADIFEPNVLVDEEGNVGLIDFANADYCDDSADFGIDEPVLCGLVLDYYGADQNLRKKLAVKKDMSTIINPIFDIEKPGKVIDERGKLAAAEKWIPLVCNVVSKYKTQSFQKD